MRNYLFLFCALLLTLILGACSESDNNSSVDSEAVEEGVDDAVSDDIWTYYSDATWEDDFNGLKMEVREVGVTDSADSNLDADAKMSAVGITFFMENTSDHSFETYPDQADIKTNTGEYVSADVLVTDDIGGVIEPGDEVEGNLFFQLEGSALEIDSLTLLWNVTDMESEDEGIYDDVMKSFEAELRLK